MKKLILFLSLMTLCICAASAQIYKWTDAQGNVHFSDVPHDGAEKVKINESQTFSPPKPINGNNSTLGTKDQTSNKPRSYTKVVISQPQNEATVRNNNGYLVVAVELEPDLTPGDNLQLLFDGAPIGEPQPNLSFQLNGIYRGEHTIAVQVLDPSGQVLNTSDSVTFFMHRARVGMGGGGTKS
ncbi:MAG: DUF4124 domain-containing protein [Legionella sp.]|nr:MAG: DUF4124 domain-containing protein [Legionella sp.]